MKSSLYTAQANPFHLEINDKELMLFKNLNVGLTNSPHTHSPPSLVSFPAQRLASERKSTLLKRFLNIDYCALATHC